MQYEKLCSRTLGILLTVLGSLQPLALAQEPADCLDAFEQFIVSLIKGDKYAVNSDTKIQVCLLCLAA